MTHRVRFNLKAGANHNMWEIHSNDGNSYYVDPQEFSLVMGKAKLVNKANAAKKIHSGEKRKHVCAWVEAETVTVTPPGSLVGSRVSYNPKVKPFWTNYLGNNIDNEEFSVLVSNGRSLFAVL